jgi:hypothetical protein
MEGTQRPTKTPASRFPENHKPIDKRNDRKAAARKKVLGRANKLLDDGTELTTTSIRASPIF